MSRKTYYLPFVLLLGLLGLVACQPETVEVTRVVTETEQVTRVITETIEVEGESVEVTRVVEEVVEVTPTAEPTPEPQEGGTLIVGRPAEIQGLDPHTNPSFTSLRFYELVYNTLVRLDENMQVAPELASSWEISEDGTEYTFELVEGVTFHDGSEMTSADVQASYERILDEETASPVRSFFTNIESIETPDDYTVVFQLSEPTAPLLTLMTSSNAMIVPQSAIEADILDSEVVGTGPFRLAEWIPDNNIILERHDDFFIEDRPYLEGIEMRVLPDEASILAGLRADTLDLGMISDVQNAVLARREDLNVYGGPGLNTHLLAFNLTRPPLDNVQVRQALACAIGRQAINDSVSFGESLPTGPLSPVVAEQYTVPFDEFMCYERDLERAQELLADAGYPDGFSMSIMTFAEVPYSDIAQIVEAQLEEIGVDVELELLERGIFIDRWVDRDFDGYVSTKSGSPDPDFALFRAFVTDGSANVFSYSNPEVDELLQQARRETDPEARAQLYRDVQRILVEEAPAVFLITSNEYRITQPYVRGFTHLPTQSIMYLRDVWLNQ
jgi:peptide/nickel transport system substrate-binding protein